MTPITLDQIRQATGARLINADPSLQIRSICTDTRNIQPGCLFIAIHGDNHDGHHHVEQAAAGGAVVAMVHADCLAHLPLLKVPDTRQAMGQLAAHIRRGLKSTVIAVAGSNGKTGTKHLIHAALAGQRTGTISPKSFNNDIGVPLAIFAADPSHDYLVLELGTNHPGEIQNLTQIAQPDVAIITSIGAEHLEFLGDIQGVITENAQIITALNPRGLLLINPDNGDRSGAISTLHRDTGLRPVRVAPGLKSHQPPNAPDLGQTPMSPSALVSAVSAYPGRIITFGFSASNELHPTAVQCSLDGVHFHLYGEPIFIPQLGRHTAVNALAAIAVAMHLGVPTAEIVRGLSTAKGPEMRLQLQTAGSIKILNDAYNANPHSMIAALETLRDLETPARKIAILGDMKELGHTADRYHRDIGEFAANCGLDQLICIGEKSMLMAEAAAAHGLTANHYPTAADCSVNIANIVAKDDLVLIKASRSMQLESVATAITTHAASASMRREVARRIESVVQAASPKTQAAS